VTDIQQDRLLKLADYLETIPESYFDIEEWVTEKDCGTVMCAAGHACMIPEFKKQGLSLEGEKNFLCPAFKGHQGLSACKMFFGTEEPFHHSYYHLYPGIMDVIKRLRIEAAKPVEGSE
jgi:hypothetical protein